MTKKDFYKSCNQAIKENKGLKITHLRPAGDYHMQDYIVDIKPEDVRDTKNRYKRIFDENMQSAVMRMITLTVELV